MKINDALKFIDAGWVRKPKGFRVYFNTFVDGQWQVDYSPGEADTPLDSDVTAWRLAWKLAQASNPMPPNFREGDLVNIYVVDDLGGRVKSYISDTYEVYHPMKVTVVEEEETTNQSEVETEVRE